VFSGAAHASVSMSWRPTVARDVASMGRTVAVGDNNFADSLRADVSRHPNDFVTFETETAGNRFLEDHWLDASRETEQRMVERGVLGYWHGKTLVVLPVLSTRKGM
jgi:hypothetical protein